MVKVNHSRVLLLALATAILVAGSLVSFLWLTKSAQAQEQNSGAIVNSPECQANSLPANDDGSTDQVALPHTLDFFGTNYDSLYVNNNGNVTFDSPLATYTPFGLQNTNRVIIAPYFADVDTRGDGSGLTTYGTTTFGGRDAFCVNWVDVGYYGSHADKLNSFQLLLVDRSDVAAGDFDIVFNYDKIQWETGDASGGSGGLGGSSSRAGYSNGGGQVFAPDVRVLGPSSKKEVAPKEQTSQGSKAAKRSSADRSGSSGTAAATDGVSFELPGSGVNGAFLDDNPSGLIHSSRGSLQLGRYVFSVRNGEAPTGGTISGKIFHNSEASGNELSGALVQVCESGGSCNTTSSNANGEYSVSGLADGSYNVRAFPPSGSSLNTGEIGPLTLSGGQTLSDQNLVLEGPAPIPAGTTITPNNGTGNGVPVVYWNNPLTLTTQGCQGGTASYQVILEDGTVASNGAMNEGPAGTYTATIPPFYPNHGSAQVQITISCPGGTNDNTDFSIYIDPSGSVLTVNGDPIEGATVTLFRSDSAAGPFEQVPNGDAVMSPANRNNPDTTDAQGHFGWDVLAGFYKVRAEKQGCTSPSDPSQSFVESDVLTIPPPVTNLDLRLDCPNLNLQPQAENDSYSVDENQTLTVSASDGVLKNDTDPEGDSLTAKVKSNPAHGNLTLNTDGSFTYEPASGFSGTDSFTYVANDGTNDSSEATVQITVNHVNQPPVAKNDSVSTFKGTSVNITVLGNDSDPDGDTLTIASNTNPSHGTVSCTSTSCTYTPSANYTGSDSFDYTVSDGKGGTATAKVNVTVVPVNDAPIANNDAYSVDEGQALSVNAPGVLQNDVDAESDPLTAKVNSNPAHGDLTLNTNGSFTYKPASGFSGKDTFTYKASDGTNDSNEATVQITVKSTSSIQPPPGKCKKHKGGHKGKKKGKKKCK